MAESFITFAVIAIVGIGVGVVATRIMGRRGGESASGDGLVLLQNQISDLVKTVDQKLTESSRTIFDSLRNQSSESNKIIRDIVQELTKVGEGQKQVLNFADQLQSLQDILKNPKQRGTILGEYFLETILQKVLPPKTYQTQYEFKNGEKVDAVVFVGKTIIPIDSKFSLENYNRIIEANKMSANPEPFVQEFKKDIKRRIDETAKYIRPEEGTLGFAFMFIPHESIYYDLLVAEIGMIKINVQDLIQYAFDKKVIIVSPTSFLAYLQTVLQGLNALQIEEQVKDIAKRVEELGRHLKSYEDYHNKLGVAISTVVNQYTLSGKEFRKIDKDVIKITGTSPKLETVTSDKPSALIEE